MIVEIDLKEVEKRARFELACEPLIKWLNDNTNPHSTVIVNSTSAELLSGEMNYNTDKFVKD